MTVLKCRADVPDRAVACSEVVSTGSGPRAQGLTVGGQHHYVRLTSANITYDPIPDVFSFTVTVQNLLQQPMATSDGTTPDTAGVQVFAVDGPNAIGPGGPVTVNNPTGTKNFTAPNQAYYQYGGSTGSELGTDGILSPGESSESKVWQLGLHGAQQFEFFVLVHTEVPAVSAAYLTFAQLAAGEAHTCGLTTSGVAYCWGSDGSGQLGDGGGEDQFIPHAIQQPVGVTFTAIAAGDAHGCGLSSAGQAYCWGANQYGQLGDNTQITRTTPVMVQQHGAVFTALAAGSDETCGLTSAGQAYCWGRNSSGEVGAGTINAARLTATAVAQPAGVAFASLAVGGAHVCGLTTAHVAYCWGNNTRGQLGDGTRTTRTSPFPVTQFGGSTLLFGGIAAGAEHTCGVTTGGVAYCWGDNDAGQLGDGAAEVVSSTPVPVSAPAGLVFGAVAAGRDHSCVLTTAGQVFCWGDNSFGQLGDGTFANVRTTPVASAPGIAFSSLVAGSVHTCGLSPVSTQVYGYCWGDGSSGQSGDGKFEFGPLVSPNFIAATH